MRNFREAVIQILNIRKPVKIVFRFLRRKYDAEWFGILDDEGYITEHIIWISQGNRRRPTKALIAHELIHAWQAENGFMQDMHGHSFQIAAGILTEKLKLQGFKFKGLIYDEGVDV